ncbi:hypothetical protein L0128_09780 [candidate division KSB1 bacterium]|nr:hypothetical protein [candidate division KSB1 bacterium]
MRTPKKQRKPFNPKDPIVPSLERPLRNSGNIGQQADLFDTGPELSIPQMIAELIKPYLRSSQRLIEIQALVNIAVDAWNLAVMPEKERAEKVRELALFFESIKLSGGEKPISEFIKRKLKYFPDIKKKINTFKVEQTPKGFSIIVNFEDAE